MHTWAEQEVLNGQYISPATVGVTVKSIMCKFTLKMEGEKQVRHKYNAEEARRKAAKLTFSILVKVQGIPIVLQDDLRYHEINDANAMRVLYYRLAV